MSGILLSFVSTGISENAVVAGVVTTVFLGTVTVSVYVPGNVFSAFSDSPIMATAFGG